jgi:hypothetical protein
MVVAAGVGCATGLPYHLNVSRDKIVGVDVALLRDAAQLTQAPAPESRVTLVRRFVRDSDLHDMSVAVGHVLSTSRLEDAADLRRLEERLVEATRMFAVDASSARSYIATPDGSEMSGKAVERVTNFVPDSSGVNFRPQPPTAGTVAFAGASVYQLGRDGAADRVLWTWTREPGARRP